jgi:TetR/AcrR family transcriptional regulator, ethionamide resistance regulator
MAAPRRARRVEGEPREALLAATERLLGECALADLTVADLLAEAGVSRASFYFYFASKYDVVIALTERIIDEVEMGAQAWFDRTDAEPEEALRTAIGAALAAWERHGPVLRAVAESWHASPELGELWGKLVGRFTTAGAERIRREREEGLAPSAGPDPDALAAALVWMNERVLYLRASGTEPALADVETATDTLVAIWQRAIYG